MAITQISNILDTDSFKTWIQKNNTLINVFNESGNGLITSLSPSYNGEDMILSITSGYLKQLDNDIIEIPGGNYDLSSYVPTTSDKIIVCGYDINGTFTVIEGTEGSTVIPTANGIFPVFLTTLSVSQTVLNSGVNLNQIKQFVDNSDFYTKSETDNIIYSLSEIVPPNITSPTDGSINFSGDISSSTFAANSKYYGTHSKSEWILAKDSAFTNIVDSYIGSSALTTWSPDVGSNPSTVMYCKVRYGSDNHWSNWSPTISFTTSNIYVDAPTLTVENEPLNVKENPVLTGSTFTIINGTDTHAYTDWEIWDSLGTTLIWSSLNNTVNLETIQVPTGYLVESTQYIFKVKYYSDTYGSSAYGTKTATTRDSFVPTPILSGSTTTNEWSSTNITIDNYDATNTYFISLDLGTFTRTNNIITCTFEEVVSTTDATLTVYASKDGSISETATFVISVVNVPIVADDTVQVVDFTLVKQYTDGFIL